jgi:hypothetical protein
MGGNTIEKKHLISRWNNVYPDTTAFFCKLLSRALSRPFGG